MNRVRRGRRLAWSLVALVMSFGRLASARAPVVVIVQSAAPDEMIIEALTRIRGELVAAGCEVVDVDGRDRRVPASARVEAAAIAQDAIAAFEIVHDAEHPGAEVWIADRLTSKPVVRRVDVPAQSGRHLSTVAVQAVELLRASLLEGLLNMAANKRVEETARPIEVIPPPPRIPHRPRFGVELGPAVMNTSLGHAAEWAAVGRITYRWLDNFATRGTFVGLGPGIEVGAAAGSAGLRQELALLETIARLPLGPFEPSVSLGLGAHHLDVVGSPSLGQVGHEGSAWSLAADAGVGASWSFSRHFTASLEGHAFVVVPAPVVRVGDEDAARLGRPAFASSLTFGAWM